MLWHGLYASRPFLVAAGAKGVRALASGVLERKTLGHPSSEDNFERQNCFLRCGNEFQQGSESTAGDPSALPLHIVMQPEAGLAGCLG